MTIHLRHAGKLTGLVGWVLLSVSACADPSAPEARCIACAPTSTSAVTATTDRQPGDSPVDPHAGLRWPTITSHAPVCLGGAGTGDWLLYSDDALAEIDDDGVARLTLRLMKPSGVTRALAGTCAFPDSPDETEFFRVVARAPPQAPLLLRRKDCFVDAHGLRSFRWQLIDLIGNAPPGGDFTSTARAPSAPEVTPFATLGPWLCSEVREHGDAPLSVLCRSATPPWAEVGRVVGATIASEHTAGLMLRLREGTLARLDATLPFGPKPLGRKGHVTGSDVLDSDGRTLLVTYTAPDGIKPTELLEVTGNTLETLVTEAQLAAFGPWATLHSPLFVNAGASAVVGLGGTGGVGGGSGVGGTGGDRWLLVDRATKQVQLLDWRWASIEPVDAARTRFFAQTQSDALEQCLGTAAIVGLDGSQHTLSAAVCDDHSGERLDGQHVVVMTRQEGSPTLRPTFFRISDAALLGAADPGGSPWVAPLAGGDEVVVLDARPASHADAPDWSQDAPWDATLTPYRLGESAIERAGPTLEGVARVGPCGACLVVTTREGDRFRPRRVCHVGDLQ